MKRIVLTLFLAMILGCSTIPVKQDKDLASRVESLENQVLMLQASGVGATTRMYGRDCIDSETDGCAKSMDDIPGTKDSDTRVQIVDPDSKIVSWWFYDPTSGAAQAYPDIIDDDTQGGDERWIKGNGSQFSGSVQIPFTDPSNLPTHLTRSNQSFLAWRNRTGLTLNIQEIRCTSDLNGYQLLLFKSASATDIGTVNDTQIDSVTTDTAGTSSWYKVITTGFDSGAIEDGKFLIFQHVSGAAKSGLCEVKGYLN